jgi:hypothetical protein
LRHFPFISPFSCLKQPFGHPKLVFAGEPVAYAAILDYEMLLFGPYPVPKPVFEPLLDELALPIAVGALAGLIGIAVVQQLLLDQVAVGLAAALVAAERFSAIPFAVFVG